jgi:hypothetical protein
MSGPAHQPPSRYLVQAEAAVTARAALRFAAFLSRELDLLPPRHPLRGQYAEHLAAVRRTHPPGPRAVTCGRRADPSPTRAGTVTPLPTIGQR